MVNPINNWAKDLNLAGGNIQMANTNMKEGLSALIIMEMKSKKTMTHPSKWLE